MLPALLAVGICLSALQDPPLELAWKNDLDDFILGTPAVHENLVIVASKRGRIAAFRLDTGKPEWTTEAEEPVISNLVLVRDRLYVPAGAKSAVLDPLNGKFLKVRCPEAVRAVPGASKVYLLGGIKFEAAYSLGSSNELICADPMSGQKSWKQNFGPLGIGAIVESGSRLYAAGQYQLYAVDAKSGKILGQSERVTPGVAFHGVAAKDRIIFTQGRADGAVCYDPKNLKELWRWKGDEDYDGAFIPPLLVGEKLIIFRMPEVVCIDWKTGKDGWKQKVDGAAEFSQLPPAVRGKEVWIGANGKLFGLDYETGKVEWMMEVAKWDGASPAPQPVWAGDRLLYACGKSVHCLKAK